MAAKMTIDWINKLFILNSGITEIDVAVDLYSDWKEDVKVSADNQLKAPRAMRSIGGDPISETQNAGATFFMENGWKIRPQEADHRLVITGNLFTDPAGESVIVPTLGNFTVAVELFLSNLIDSTKLNKTTVSSIEDIRRANLNTRILNDATGKEEILDDDDNATPLLSGDAFEDAAGTVPYNANSTKVRRRNKMV